MMNCRPHPVYSHQKVREEVSVRKEMTPLQVPLQSQHAHVLQDFVHTRFPRANELQIRAGYTIPSTISFSSPHNSPVANELQIQAQSSSHPMWPVPVTAQ